VRDAQRPVLLRAGQDDREFLATVARHEIGASLDAAGQDRRDTPQARVAGRAAVPVVEPVEEVDVEHQQRDGRPIAEALLPFLFEEFREPCPAGELGELVDLHDGGPPRRVSRSRDAGIDSAVP
jgi:hypothetical protein